MAEKIKQQNLPEGWSPTRLGSQVKIFNGGAFSSTDSAPHGVRWVKIANVGVQNIKWDTKSFLPERFLHEYKQYKLEDEDIVVALTRPTLGRKLKIASIQKKDSPALLNQRVGKLKFSKLINKKFGYYFLILDRVAYEINQLLAGSDPPNLSSSAFDYISINLPPILEQKRIVSVLEVWDQAIEKLKRKIETKKEIKKGLMQELLAGKTRLSGFKDEWRIFKFKDVVFDIWDYRGKTPLKLGMKWGGSISALSANNVKRGYIDFDSECHMASEELYKKWMNKGDLKKGDIVFTMEAPLGNVAMITDNKKYLLSQRVVSFRISKEFSSIFVYHYMLSDAFQDRLKMLATGSTAKGVNQKALSKVTFSAPTIDEQLAVSNLLTTADQEIKKLEQKLKIFQKQKKYLLNNLITGTIRTPESLSIFK